jgi:hypothetical protein
MAIALLDEAARGHGANTIAGSDGLFQVGPMRRLQPRSLSLWIRFEFMISVLLQNSHR